MDTSAFANAYDGTFAVTNIGNTVAVSYAAPSVALTPPTLSGFSPLSGTSFPLTFIGPNGQTYHVLRGTNVALPLANWTVLSTGTLGSSPVTNTDTSATNAHQLYGIKSP